VAGFKKICGLPSIHSTIDIIHIHIQKPNGPFTRDYYSFKSKTFNMHLHTIVDNWGSSNMCLWGCLAWRMMAISWEFPVCTARLWMGSYCDWILVWKRKIKPYILGDKWYPLLPWFMILHKQIGNVPHIALEALFNEQLSWGRRVIKNAFGILKKIFNDYFWKQTCLSLFYLMW
jgi:hypothetical protein